MKKLKPPKQVWLAISEWNLDRFAMISKAEAKRRCINPDYRVIGPYVLAAPEPSADSGNASKGDE